MTKLEAKANIFNKFFVQMCSETSTSSTLPSFTPRSRARLEGFSINREKVHRLIRSLDSKKAHGCDEISIAMIKICDLSIVEPLCLIFEDCLEKGMYPSLWKKANVIPIHKEDSRRCKTNYRPILLLPIFGKLYEKIIFDSVYNHLRQNGLLLLLLLGLPRVACGAAPARRRTLISLKLRKERETLFNPAL